MNLKTTVAVLKPDLSVQPVSVTPDLYEKLDQQFDHFSGHTLISLHSFTEDWGVWERHPAGDEVVVLLSGSCTMVLRKESGEESLELHEVGAYVIVPKNTWHTARFSENATLMFITPGEGTENKESPE